MKKLMFTFIIAFTVLFGGSLLYPIQSNASSLTEVDNTGTIDLNNLNELEKSDNVTIKEISYEEFIEKIAKSQGISEKAAKVLHPNHNKTIESDYSIMSDPYSMFEINITQNVATFYKPSIQMFVWTYHYGSFTSFDHIEVVDLNRGYNGISKQFSGKVQGKMTSSTKIWWYVNGDFYDNGTTSYDLSGGGEGGVGVTITGSFTVAYSSNHYKYWNNSGTYSLS